MASSEDVGAIGMILVAVGVLLLFGAMLGARIMEEWRPLVTTWAEAQSPHLGKPIEIPGTVEWRGVQYDCVLRAGAKKPER